MKELICSNFLRSVDTKIESSFLKKAEYFYDAYHMYVIIINSNGVMQTLILHINIFNTLSKT
jgi:hypothetical protein